MRTVAAIILTLIVAVEAYLMLDYQPKKGLAIPDPTGRTAARQAREADQHTQKYALLIGATILVGGIVVFSLPSKRNNKEKGH